MRTNRIWSWVLIAAIAAMTWAGGGGMAHAQTKIQKRTKGTPRLKVPTDGGAPWTASGAAESADSQVRRGDDGSGGRVGGPPNDDCANSIPIFDGVTPFSTIGATTDGLPDPLCDASDDDQVGADIWYDYTATCSETLTVSTCNDADYNTKIAIYSRVNCPAQSIVACNDDAEGCASLTSRAQASVVEGSPYKIRVGGYEAATGSGNLMIFCNESGLVNDDCAGAIPITEGDTPFSNNGAIMDGPDLPAQCAEGFGLVLGFDIWYDYTPSECGIVTVSTCDSDYDVRIAAYQECDCPVTNGRLVGCDDDFCEFAGPSQMEFPANAGTCYKLRIGGWDNGDDSEGSGTINITVEDAGLCCGAEGDCCSSGGNGTPGCDDLACCLTVCALDGFCCQIDWDSTCAAFAAELCSQCDDDPCDPGAGDCCSNNGTAGCEDPFCCATVCAADPDCCDVGWDADCAATAVDLCPVCGGGPPNDDCADAIAVSEGEFAYSNVGASMDGPDLPPECDDGFGVVLGSDLWYAYTPSVTGVATVTTCDLTDYDVRIAAYSGCDCPVTNDRVVACDDDGCGEIGGESVMEFPVVAGECYKLRIGGWEEASQGSGSILISAEGQPAPNPLSSDPPNCAIDARQPSDIDCEELFGWDVIEVVFDGDASGVLAAHFTVTVDPPDTTPPSIVNVVPSGNTATLELDGPIPPGHWTTFTYAPSDPDWSTKIGYLPADVSGDGTSGPVDILDLIDFLNEVGPTLAIWQTDIDRSGESNPADILGVIDLLNGAGCFDVWNGQALPGDCP